MLGLKLMSLLFTLLKPKSTTTMTSWRVVMSSKPPTHTAGCARAGFHLNFICNIPPPFGWTTQLCCAVSEGKV